MESGDETNTSISDTSEDTVDLRSLVTALPSPSSSSRSNNPSSSVNPQSYSIQFSSNHITSSTAMAATSSTTGVPESSNNFSMNAYTSVTTLESGTFNDWRLRLTTVMGAHRLSKYILRDVKVPEEEKALDDHEPNLMRALAAIHATIDKENFEVVRHCSNPRDAFIKLCKHHDDAGGLSTANLFSDLVTLRLSSEGDLKEHIHLF